MPIVNESGLLNLKLLKTSDESIVRLTELAWQLAEDECRKPGQCIMPL